MTRTDGPTRRGRLMLLGLIGVFLVPAAIAWTLYFSGWRPPATGNHGELLNPPERLELPAHESLAGPASGADEVDVRGKWTLLHEFAGPCADPCRERLRETRQVRRALAQDADRAQRILLLAAGTEPPDDRLLERHADLHVIRLNEAGGDLRPGGRDGVPELSLVETRGFRMMRLTGVEAGAILDDLKHLLRLSNVDLERLDGLSERD